MQLPQTCLLQNHYCTNVNTGPVAENVLLWPGWARMEHNSDLQIYQNTLQGIKIICLSMLQTKRTAVERKTTQKSSSFSISPTPNQKWTIKLSLLKPANKMSALISDNPPQIHPRIFCKYKKKQTISKQNNHEKGEER